MAAAAVVAHQSFLSAGSALAQGEGQSSGNVGVPTPVGGDVTLSEYVGRFINGALGLTGVVALAVFVYAGFLMMTARGNAKQDEKAKQTMFWASIGLLGVFASYAALRFVLQMLGA